MAEHPCPGCRLSLPIHDGPTHPYIGASPACWALFGDVLAREFSDFRYGRIHGTTVDAYAVQHPGVPERRSTRSVALHLIRLLLVIEQEEKQERATQMMARVARSHVAFEWLDPPVPNGTKTIADVKSVDGPDEHVAVVQEWAAGLWGSWSRYHMIVKGWLRAGLA